MRIFHSYVGLSEASPCFPTWKCCSSYKCTIITKGSLEVKLPTVWTDEKQRWEESEKRREEESRSKKRIFRRKKIQVREKVGKSRNAVFFQWFVAPEGRKVGSPKRRVRSQLARWEMKNCTPLWREAHLQVKKLNAPHVRSTFRSCDIEKVQWREGHFQAKMYKAHHSQTTFGSWGVEKVYAVVARSTFPSQNVQNTLHSEHFWTLRCSKSVRGCGAKHVSKSKCTKHTMSGPLLEVQMSKKCTPLWCEAHFEVKSAKNWRVRSTFGRSDVVSRGQRNGLRTWSKVSTTWRFSSNSQNDGRRGAFEEDLERCIFCGRRSTRDMFIKDVSKSGRWFPERHGLEKSQTHWYEAVSSALSFPLLKEVSQTCFVFDVANSENWGSLAELLRFWCCQLRKLRKSRRIASFLTSSSSKVEEVSQNYFVFKLADGR